MPIDLVGQTILDFWVCYAESKLFALATTWNKVDMFINTIDLFLSFYARTILEKNAYQSIRSS